MDAKEFKEIKKLADDIGTNFEEYKKVNDERIATLEKGEGTAELETKLTKLDAKLSENTELKDRLEKLEAKANDPAADPDNPDAVKAAAAGTLQRWLAKGEKSDELYQMAVNSGLDIKAINITTGGDGGVAVPEIIDRIITDEMVDISPIRAISQVQKVSTSDYKKLVNTRGTTSGWVGETTARTETNTPTLVEIAPTFGEVYAEPRATQWALDDVFFSVEQFLKENVATEFAQEEGNKFVVGDGTNSPTGFLDGTPVVTADVSRAFGVLQYIKSGAAADITDPDALLDVIYSLKAGYRANARWVSGRLTLATVRKLKQNSEYIWAPGLVNGQPSTLLGYPVTEAEDMPVIAANSFSLAFGDFKKGYLIADRVGTRMLRDPYTAKPYVKFYTTRRVGGILQDDNAIKLLKCEV